MIKEVIVTLQFQAIHNWDNCNIPVVDYLRHPHRHIFYITCTKEVADNDREIEIIMLKNEIYTYLLRKYYSEEFGMGNLNSMSCEMLAEELLNVFNLTSCTVLEDNENGAKIRRK